MLAYIHFNMDEAPVKSSPTLFLMPCTSYKAKRAGLLLMSFSHHVKDRCISPSKGRRMSTEGDFGGFLRALLCITELPSAKPRTQGRLCDSTCSRKEVFQPHLPVRLPCYDLAPITSFALDRSAQSSGAPGFHGLTGGVYKARERIHRAMADARLLANPASRSRVPDSDPN